MEKPYKRCVEGCPYIKNGKCDYFNKHIPIIAVDFDRVLFKHKTWNGHEHIGDLMPDAIWGIKQLKQMGFKIMVWTTRIDRDIVEKALKENNVPFDFINNNPNQPPEINPSKPVADYYIDDRAVHFTNWKDVIEQIKIREKNDGYYKE
jgi:hypothetical protein